MSNTFLKISKKFFHEFVFDILRKFYSFYLAKFSQNALLFQNAPYLAALFRRRKNLLAFARAIIYYNNMYKILRIAFCILAVACAAVTVFIFTFFKTWGLIPLGGALLFAALMLICKNAQERQQQKDAAPTPQGDYITGRVENTDVTKGKDDEK